MMDNAINSAQKDGCTNENLDLQNFRTKDAESAEEDSFSKSLVIGINPEDILLLDVGKSKFSEFCIQKLFLERISFSNTEKRIPRQITSLDELYLRQCMELIHISAFRAASLNNLSDINILSDSHDCSFILASNENVIAGPTGDSVLGTITRSTSMMNILQSPLFLQLGGLDNAVKFGKRDLEDIRETIDYPVINSSEDFCLWPPHKLEKDRSIPGNGKYGYENAHKRLVSISSSTTSTFSSESSCSTSTSFSQGMLHCSWNNGFPHYEFTVDDRRETYIANLSNDKSSDVKVFDYVYTFHSRLGRKKGDAIHEKLSDVVGKMRVSTSFTLCPKNMEIMETQFVLSASSDNFLAEMQTSGDLLKKNKGLSKKIGNTFMSGQKQRSSSKSWGPNVIPESSVEQCENSFSGVSPNLELAAIIVKNHAREDSSKKVEIGGWGLKFLKSKGNCQPNIIPEVILSCEYCQQSSGDHCSTSMEVLIPAGFHGGPRTSNGGPASLIERRNGQCDCGGWDIGCPITVLNNKPSNKDVLPQGDVPGINSFDLFVQGSKQNALMVKIMSIQDGLYYVQYQSSLSALQSLSIAVAIIHSRSPTLRPKLYRT